MITNIENAFKFIFKDKNWAVKILVGGIVLIIPVVNFIAFGYILKVLKGAKEGRPAYLPEWEDGAKLFGEGVALFIVAFAYGLIIFAIWIITILISFIPVIGCLALVLTPLIIVALILLSPAVNISLCRYIDKGEVREAFRVKEIVEELKSKPGDYAIVTLVSAGVAFIGSLIFYLAPFIFFWLFLAAARMFGEIYWMRPTRMSL